MNAGKIPLKGSHKTAPPAENTHAIDEDKELEISIRIRRKRGVDALLSSGKQVSLEEYENEYGASQQDVDAVVEFAKGHHLTVVTTDLARRTITFRGTAADIQHTFEVKLAGYTDEHGVRYRGRSGDIFVPEVLAGVIEGVFGLDDRPLAKPLKLAANTGNQVLVPEDASASFAPNKIAELYKFPEGYDGSGECIALIELSGGYRDSDMQTYFGGLGIPVPSIRAVSVDGGANNPTVAGSSDNEVGMDIQVAGAVAPGATIAVYFTTNNDKGFLDAITAAIHDTTYRPSIIAISWGAAEEKWTEQSRDNYNEAFKTAAALGITICVSSGDFGSNDRMFDGKAHVEYPATSPYVLACGGTKLVVNADGSLTEKVWNEGSHAASGGGVSEFFDLPDYQQQAGVPLSVNTNFKGRGVPDVAAHADFNTGYQILIDGKQLVSAGTSAVAPLMAGLIARLNQRDKLRHGFINPKLYANAAAVCRDITEGNNITTASGKGYTAGPGWDACTGWGVLFNL